MVLIFFSVASEFEDYIFVWNDYSLLSNIFALNESHFAFLQQPKNVTWVRVELHGITSSFLSNFSLISDVFDKMNSRMSAISKKNHLKVFSTSHSSLIRWLRLKWWSLRSHYQRTLVQIPEDVEAAFSSTLKLENVLVYGGMYPVIRGLDTSRANKLAGSR